MDLQTALRQIDAKDLMRAWTVSQSRFDSMLRAITNERKLVGRSLALYLTQNLRRINGQPYSVYYSQLDSLRDNLGDLLDENAYIELRNKSDFDLLRLLESRVDLFLFGHVVSLDALTRNALSEITNNIANHLRTETNNNQNQQPNNNSTYKGFFVPVTTEDITEEVEDIEEAYSDEELDELEGKTFNLQKIENIYRRKKYDTPQLFAHTRCVKCGREKRVFLSNLINDPKKYGSCICSDVNLDSRLDNVTKIYSNRKKLKTNTSGYTGVSFVKNYSGKPYNKWRAYIEVDGTRTYLGDFDTKKEAIKARKEAGEKGIKWYRENRNKLVKNVRRRTKKYQTSKYRDTLEKTKYQKGEDK